MVINYNHKLWQQLHKQKMEHLGTESLLSYYVLRVLCTSTHKGGGQHLRVQS